MVHPPLMPMSAALALTFAAALSITAEHAGSSQAAAVSPLAAQFAPHGTGNGEARKDAADARPSPQATGVAATMPSLSVGSRALVGNDAHSLPCTSVPDD